MDALTVEQVLALAPDAPSIKAGQGLANPAKWAALGRGGRAVWGECQGSALYRTQADLTGPAFHCSCPSRKFPCKHGLGLLLLLAGNPARVAETPPPTWVEEWLARREAGVQKKSAKVQAESESLDPEAAAKRQAERERRASKREDRVRAGLGELQTWLGDLLRQGFVQAKTHPAKFYDTMAARMIDAQAPGIARRLRTWPGILASGDGWADRFLEETGALQWLLNGAARLDALPEGLRASVRAAIGWTTGEQELLADRAAEIVADRWQIAGQRMEEEDQLRVLRTWLVGEKTQRSALCLSFAAGAQPLDVSLVAGTVMEAELIFYPSAAPLRAAVGKRLESPRPLEEPATTCDDFTGAMDLAAGWMAGDPWLERVPWFVRDCVPVRADEAWFLRDARGALVPLARSFAHAWPLLATSGGAPVTVFGEWNGRSLLPLSVIAEKRFIPLGGAALP